MVKKREKMGSGLNLKELFAKTTDESFVRQEMGVDPAFQGAGQMPGLEIWRIEKMKVCPVDKADYGKFYSGDSYIVLDTVKIQTRFEWHIHFWLGKESTRDEAGAAAIKSIELDDYLGGGPIQHREVQEHESDRFQSMFKSGVQYLEGGVDSGFVDTSKLKFNKRLYHIKGRRKVRITQTAVSWESLNEGDVFVLDCKESVWCWVGDECSRLEKIKGMEFARKVKDEEKGGRATLVLAEDAVLKNKFLEQLDIEDASTVKVKTAAEGGDDEQADKVERKIALHRVCDESGELEITEVGNSPLRHEMLDTNDCFILDMGQSGVYAWIGKKATADERREAFMNAQQFIEDKGYPSWTPLCRVVEGAEDNLFTSCFNDWPRKNLSKNVPVQEVIQTPSQIKKQSEMDLSSLHKAQNRDALLQEDIKDDGCGTVKIWRVEKFDLVEVEDSIYGTFWDGDSYIVLYTYIAPGRSHESFIIYFWLGSHSTNDERGAAALHATRIDGEVGWSSQQMRVVQGKEPLHFLRMFGRRITILQGGVESGFRKKGPAEEVDETPEQRLFHIKCVNDYVKSLELQCRAASLNSNDSFVLLTKHKTYIWYGKGCDAEERYTGKLLAEKVDRKMLIGVNGVQVQLVEMEEGNEPDEFWECLGGKGEYASGVELEHLVNERPPRLFQMSNASGYFKVEEIYNFNQDDLIEEDTMLLDTGTTLFVWIGSGANEIEKKQGLLAAREYLRQDPSGRTDEDVKMLSVKQGLEPPAFTGHFQAWDSRKWSGGLTYDEMAKQMGFESLVSVDDELKKYSMKHPYEVLVKGVVPEGVDIVNKERYLNESDFKDIFGMSLEEYDLLPQWKRLRLKKSVNLF